MTPHPMVGFWVQRTAGDYALRATLARLGAQWHTESALVEWTGTGGVVRSLLDGKEQTIEADTLVLSTTNTSERAVLAELGDRVPEVHAAGDAVAARLAVHAIYEGRVVGMAL